MALKRPIWVAGCMSGTSLDGVDVACILTDGVQVLEFGPSAYRAYSDTERATISAAFRAWHGEDGVAQAAHLVEQAHIEVLREVPKPALIGFHGQTLAHDPGGRGTHQTGSGVVIAAAMDCPVAWDFRSNDVAMGGQGAPLAPIYHWALAQNTGFGGPTAFLNLGGVGNITYVDPAIGPDSLIAFDTGPANAPIDDLMLQRNGKRFDTDGAVARSGIADQAAVDRVLGNSYFQMMPPKSLDRDQFAEALLGINELETTDAAATLTAIVAQSVALGLKHLPAKPEQIWVCGGGRKNGLILEQLTITTGCDVQSVEVLGFDGDMIEAQAFAYLAARVQAGLPTSFPGTTGVAMSLGGGIVSRP